MNDSYWNELNDDHGKDDWIFGMEKDKRIENDYPINHEEFKRIMKEGNQK